MNKDVNVTDYQDIKFDDLPDDLKVLVEFGIFTKEEALYKYNTINENKKQNF